MGYRDAWDYLAQRQPNGVPHDATCTAMTDPLRGVRFTERLRGDIDDSALTLEVTVELPLPRDCAGSRVRSATLRHLCRTSHNASTNGLPA
jgi:hypothetical protein